MTSPSWRIIKEQVYERAGGCCEYCLTCELNIGQALHIEHIDPKGGDQLDNLCLACPNCNLSKSIAIAAIDPITNELVPLFNPRTQNWDEHFRWEENFTMIGGITPSGRASVEKLKMNRPRIVLTRSRWVQAGLHPNC